jgi:cytidine deaminase
MDEEIVLKLIDEAKNMSLKNNCCKHTNYSVGACVLTEDNVVYKGFNIENDGLLSICAERVAFSKALSEGKTEFKAIFVCGKSKKDKMFVKTLPCGYCRQFMSEYAGPDLLIYTFDDSTNKVYKYKLEELLPESFSYRG